MSLLNKLAEMISRAQAREAEEREAALSMKALGDRLALQRAARERGEVVPLVDRDAVGPAVAPATRGDRHALARSRRQAARLRALREQAGEVDERRPVRVVARPAPGPELEKARAALPKLRESSTVELARLDVEDVARCEAYDYLEARLVWAELGGDWDVAAEASVVLFLMWLGQTGWEEHIADLGGVVRAAEAKVEQLTVERFGRPRVVAERAPIVVRTREGGRDGGRRQTEDASRARAARADERRGADWARKTGDEGAEKLRSAAVARLIARAERCPAAAWTCALRVVACAAGDEGAAAVRLIDRALVEAREKTATQAALMAASAAGWPAPETAGVARSLGQEVRLVRKQLADDVTEALSVAALSKLEWAAGGIARARAEGVRHFV